MTEREYNVHTGYERIIAEKDAEIAELKACLGTRTASADRLGRAEFQQYAEQCGCRDFEADQDGNGGYRNPYTQARWDFWKASRDALQSPVASTDKKQGICIYCGHLTELGAEDAAEQIIKHHETCEKSPQRALEAQVAYARTILTEWLATEIDPEDEEYEGWIKTFTEHVEAFLAGTPATTPPLSGRSEEA